MVHLMVDLVVHLMVHAKGVIDGRLHRGLDGVLDAGPGAFDGGWCT